ncbi:MAG: hypothetical protein RIT45_1830 [Pseudomonadota bacterium]
MIHVAPDLAATLAYEGEADAALLSVSLLADTETPISIFVRLGGAERGPAFLLESVEGGEQMARYSFLATRVTRTLREPAVAGRDPLAAVREAVPPQRLWTPEPAPRFAAGAVGLFGFGCVRAFEPVPTAPGPAPAAPDIALLLPDVVVAYDHVRRRVALTTVIPLDGDAAARCAAWERGRDRLGEVAERLRTGPAAPPLAALPASMLPTLDVRPNQSRAGFEAAVRTAQEAIGAGEIFQVVLSQRFDVHAEVEPLALYRALRAINPSPYMFLVDFGDVALVGASPEVLVRVEDGDVLVRPIAGTRRRGADPTEDAALEADLRADPKELAEHRMLLDLGRNDVGRVAATGTVRVEDPLHIERYSHVMHIVSDVHGTLAPEHDALDALRAAFPAGTVSGAPKVRALEIIAALEPDARGAYAGAVGYLDVRGNLDTAIAIRTMVVQNGVVSVQAGAGIVQDSDPGREHEECVAKARAAMEAIRLAVAQTEVVA